MIIICNNTYNNNNVTLYYIIIKHVHNYHCFSPNMRPNIEIVRNDEDFHVYNLRVQNQLVPSLPHPNTFIIQHHRRTHSPVMSYE